MEISHLLAVLTVGLSASWTHLATAEPDPGSDQQNPRKTSGDARATTDATDASGKLVFRVRGGAEIGFRSFEDGETSSRSSRTYHAAPLPGIFAGVEFLPREDGVFALDVAVAQSLGVKSYTDDAAVGDVFSTARTVSASYLRADAAVKARWVLGEGPLPAFAGGFLGFAYSRFAFSDPPRNAELPAATYSMLRLGAEGRVPFGALSVFASAEFDALLGIGYLGNARPSPPGPGTTLRAGATFALTSWLAARVEGSYAMFAFSMVRDVGAIVTDQYGAVRLGLEARL